MDHVRRRFTVAGQVQGVGFRPYIYRLALDHGLVGQVFNAPEGVRIEVQGQALAVQSFSEDLRPKAPPLAVISSLESQDVAVEPDCDDFVIRTSAQGQGHNVLISPDVATCEDCLAEMNDPADRRHGYPFINCTNCGPRYTITHSIPYDRPVTSMACFPLCPDCHKEYDNPLDRRFHAQPNACAVCGPKIWLTNREGNILAEHGDALEQTAAALAQGKIVALKGLGGFHLACDATNHQAVTELRRRKERYGKPLAIMTPNLETARRLAAVCKAEERLLSPWQRPIVLCRKLAGSPLSSELAPDTDFVGIMLPYTPLHHLLLSAVGRLLDPAALVMTSGNRSTEPISLGNREALRRLSAIADLFLFHNRDILIRCDDSVVRAVETLEGGSASMFLRRARGFTPNPVDLPVRADAPTILAVGPELKNTFCVTKGAQAFPSQHIGDMENLETMGFFQEMTGHLPKILQVEPQAVVRDLHPDYMTSRFAEEYASRRGIRLLSLQHHAAHIFAVLAEHRRLDMVVGLALDGTGYGLDGTVWGGECLLVDPASASFQRLGHFHPVRLPGGEAAVREPWRMARSFLHGLGVKEPLGRHWNWLKSQAQADQLAGQMLDKGVNSPWTTSCGRLFDAVAGLLGLCEVMDYEGQAAILLERAQDMTETGAYECPILQDQQPVVLDTLRLFAQVHEDWAAGVPSGVISRRFHRGLIQGLADLALSMADVLGVASVALSGGVMQNLTLANELPAALMANGLEPLTHSLTPPNDACISLGQAFWALLAFQNN